MANKYYFISVSTEQIAEIEAAGLKEIAASMRSDVAEIESDDASACRREGIDNEENTIEWSGPVSYCDDGKAWVLGWQLVDNPNAKPEEEEEAEAA